MAFSHLTDDTNYSPWVVQRRRKKYLVIELALESLPKFTEFQKQLLQQSSKGYLIERRQYYNLVEDVFLCLRPQERVAIVSANFSYTKIGGRTIEEDQYIKEMVEKARPILCSYCSSIEVVNITIEVSSIDYLGVNVI